ERHNDAGWRLRIDRCLRHARQLEYQRLYRHATPPALEIRLPAAQQAAVVGGIGSAHRTRKDAFARYASRGNGRASGFSAAVTSPQIRQATQNGRHEYS